MARRYRVTSSVGLIGVSGRSNEVKFFTPPDPLNPPHVGRVVVERFLKGSPRTLSTRS